MIGKMVLEDGRTVNIKHACGLDGGEPVAVEFFTTSGDASRYAAKRRREGYSTATRKTEIAINALSVYLWGVVVRTKKASGQLVAVGEQGRT